VEAAAMTTPDELREAATQARAVAEDLRRLASRIDASHVHALPRLADDRTWVGPLASSLQDAVRRGVAELRLLSSDLRAQATQLELEASERDRAATRTALVLSAP
jgi:hypothetical protein